MKKVTLTLLGLVAFSTSALAQQEVKFGPKAGVNFANINGGDAEDAKMVTSFHIGGFAEIKFNDKFAVQPEILYSGQGASYDESGNGWSYESTAKLSYINVPIMAKYYVIPSVAVEAGPYVGFLVKSELDVKDTFEGDTTEYTEDMKNGTNSIDFGLGFGASYNMDNGFFVGARYNLGLTKITKNYKGVENGVEVEYQESDVKNGVIQVGVGYKF